MTPFFICEGLMAPSATLSLARAVDLNWQSLGDVYLHICDVHLNPPQT